MAIQQTEINSRWDPVKQLMAGAAPVTLGAMHAFHMANSPRRMLYTMSYYKFAAKHIASNAPRNAAGKPAARVLDIGCGEGLGTWLLAKECCGPADAGSGGGSAGHAHGIDIDADLIATANANWVESPSMDGDPSASFSCDDFLAMRSSTDGAEDRFHGVVSMDVIEHILPDNADAFVANIAAHLLDDGVAVVGTPNITSRPYASEVTNAGHVNMYTGESLEEAFARHFQHVFVFAANDEVVHTGFFPMAHYLIALACQPRR